MNMKERKKGPVRRGGARGRVPARRENEATPVKKKGERGDQNWTKKFEEGDFDDLFDPPPDEEADEMVKEDVETDDESAER